MKLARLSLCNFRGYANVDVVFDENFNVIIGKNDVGKSTILDALEIFFNSEIVKIEIEDFNVHASDKTMTIQVSFWPENKGYTIDTIPTDLKKEFLLDRNGLVTIKKTWDCSKDKLTAASLKTYIIANYPKNFDTPLISEKISELKRILQEFKGKINVDEVKKNTSSEIRQAIYDASALENFHEIEIPIDKEDGKKVWDSLKADLPLFFIFQADRENKDTDKQVQDPLKAITRSAISQLDNELEEVKKQIQLKAEEIGQKTLEKLKEMNPEIADVLRPEMSNKPWETLFSFSFTCDDGIAINKRGSGVRRLILLNYFRAEAERQNSLQKNVIYAIEEPETSQHPDWQMELFKALLDLSINKSTQVLTTTHSPALASLVNTQSIIFICREDDAVVVQQGDHVDLAVVAKTLGVLPDISKTHQEIGIKKIVCVEGPTDIDFFYNIGKLFNLDLENDERILFVSLGGGTLLHWVNKNYLRKLGKPEIHIYDSDVKKYREAVDEVNARGNGWATMTKMLEIENYIHPSLIKKVYSINDDFIDLNNNWLATWGSRDVSKELSIFLKNLKANGCIHIVNESESKVKKCLTSDGAKLMNLELLIELGAHDEVKGWFDKIAED